MMTAEPPADTRMTGITHAAFHPKVTACFRRSRHSIFALRRSMAQFSCITKSAYLRPMRRKP